MVEKFRGTTIVCVKKDGKVAMAGDGQVTLGETVFKKTAKKIRKIEKYGVLVGFAGSVADAMALMERFEKRLEERAGDILKASVDLAKEWRLDKALRRLEAMLLVANKEKILIISGSGDVIEPDEDVAAIGSGGAYALAAAKAFLKSNVPYTAKWIAEESLKIAAEICIYTNTNITSIEV